MFSYIFWLIIAVYTAICVITKKESSRHTEPVGFNDNDMILPCVSNPTGIPCSFAMARRQGSSHTGRHGIFKSPPPLLGNFLSVCGAVGAVTKSSKKSVSQNNKRSLTEFKLDTTIKTFVLFPAVKCVGSFDFGVIHRIPPRQCLWGHLLVIRFG